MVGLADARQHEELRRVEHAAGQQHLARGQGAMQGAVARVLDARRARAVEDDTRRERARYDREVRPAHCRPQYGHRGAAAPTLADRPLTAAEPLLVLAVVVLGVGPVGLASGVEPGVEQRVVVARVDDGERPAAATPGVLALLPALASLEVGEDFGV